MNEFYAIVWQWNSPNRFFYMMFDNKSFVEYSSKEDAVESAEKVIKNCGGKEAGDPHYDFKVVKCLS